MGRKLGQAKNPSLFQGAFCFEKDRVIYLVPWGTLQLKLPRPWLGVAQPQLGAAQAQGPLGRSPSPGQRRPGFRRARISLVLPGAAASALALASPARRSARGAGARPSHSVGKRGDPRFSPGAGCTGLCGAGESVLAPSGARAQRRRYRGMGESRAFRLAFVKTVPEPLPAAAAFPHSRTHRSSGLSAPTRRLESAPPAGGAPPPPVSPPSRRAAEEADTAGALSAYGRTGSPPTRHRVSGLSLRRGRGGRAGPAPLPPLPAGPGRSAGLPPPGGRGGAGRAARRANRRLCLGLQGAEGACARRGRPQPMDRAGGGGAGGRPARPPHWSRAPSLWREPLVIGCRRRRPRASIGASRFLRGAVGSGGRQ